MCNEKDLLSHQIPLNVAMKGDIVKQLRVTLHMAFLCSVTVLARCKSVSMTLILFTKSLITCNISS